MRHPISLLVVQHTTSSLSLSRSSPSQSPHQSKLTLPTRCYRLQAARRTHWPPPQNSNVPCWKSSSPLMTTVLRCADLYLEKIWAGWLRSGSQLGKPRTMTWLPCLPLKSLTANVFWTRYVPSMDRSSPCEQTFWRTPTMKIATNIHWTQLTVEESRLPSPFVSWSDSRINLLRHAPLPSRPFTVSLWF